MHFFLPTPLRIDEVIRCLFWCPGIENEGKIELIQTICLPKAGSNISSSVQIRKKIISFFLVLVYIALESRSFSEIACFYFPFVKRI